MPDAIVEPPQPQPHETRLLVQDEKIPSVIRATLADMFEFRTGSGAELGFCKFDSVDGTGTRWGQILFFRRADLDALKAGGVGGPWIYTVEITPPDAAASAARPGGLRPSGRIVLVEPMPAAKPA